jgi:site-specific DNA-methyltransferase (adenine-specific)
MGQKTRKRVSTETSSFGAPGRISHDASRFYASRLYDGIPGEQVEQEQENEVPLNILDRFYCKSSTHMEEIPDRSVHLIVTSPPYNVTKQYDDDLNLEEYLDLLRQVWQETFRVLAPGGRACINVANLGRKPYIPIHSYIIEQMQAIGYLMRGEIIWNKGSSASPSTAWGSWRSARNPVLRDTHEYILIFSKDSFRRDGHSRESTIEKADFLEWTKSVWSFPTISARKVGHPAPFPEELPHRLIQLFTFRDDVVLDPFCGSGTTCLAARRDGRHYLGYDTNPDYLKIAETRLNSLPSPNP